MPISDEYLSFPRESPGRLIKILNESAHVYCVYSSFQRLSGNSLFIVGVGLSITLILPQLRRAVGKNKTAVVSYSYLPDLNNESLFPRPRNLLLS